MRRRTRGLRVVPQGPPVAPGEVAAGVAGAGSGDLQLQQPLRVEADDRLELGVDRTHLHTAAAAAVTRGSCGRYLWTHRAGLEPPPERRATPLSAGMHAIMHSFMKRASSKGLRYSCGLEGKRAHAPGNQGAGKHAHGQQCDPVQCTRKCAALI